MPSQVIYYSSCSILLFIDSIFCLRKEIRSVSGFGKSTFLEGGICRGTEMPVNSTLIRTSERYWLLACQEKVLYVRAREVSYGG